jgi:hypothetical protein
VVAEKFWRYVDKGPENQCWLWKGAKSTYGYGQMTVSTTPRRFKKAHRVSYEIHKGPLTSEDVVRHSCDVPLCCNPLHLEKGTQSENHADMVAKGRNSWAPHEGHQNPNVKLTADEVRAIRASDLSYSQAAAKYGVTKAAIAAIQTRRRWSHI